VIEVTGGVRVAGVAVLRLHHLLSHCEQRRDDITRPWGTSFELCERVCVCVCLCVYAWPHVGAWPRQVRALLGDEDVVTAIDAVDCKGRSALDWARISDCRPAMEVRAGMTGLG
jgi:hypothetical protein